MRNKPAAVTIEYPHESEKVAARKLTFRILAYETERVEIRIDQGRWRPCRFAGGFWWYDWSGFKTGAHEAMVRIHPRFGIISVSGTRRFLVDLPSLVPTHGRC
jgi:hypothetical protein